MQQLPTRETCTGPELSYSREKTTYASRLYAGTCYLKRFCQPLESCLVALKLKLIRESFRCIKKKYCQFWDSPSDYLSCFLIHYEIKTWKRLVLRSAPYQWNHILLILGMIVSHCLECSKHIRCRGILLP